MLALSVFLNAFGIWKLRKWNPSGEPVQQREAPEDAEDSPEIRSKAHAAPGTARAGLANPILWREIRTLAYGRRPLLVKVAYGVVIALICYFAFGNLPDPARPSGFRRGLRLGAHHDSQPAADQRTGRDFHYIRARRQVPGLTSSHRHQSQEFVFGKIGGVLYNTKEFIIPPLLVAVYYAIVGGLAYTQEDEIALVPGQYRTALLCAGRIPF